MQTGTLTRFLSTKEGTFGELTLWKLKFFTGELPWRSNAEFVSCIPSGVYRCSYQFAPHFKKSRYHVDGVPGRSGIFIHPANFVGDSAQGLFSEVKGCIALGRILSDINGQKALLKTEDAVKSFETFLEGKDFTLEIKNGPDIHFKEVYPLPLQ